MKWTIGGTALLIALVALLAAIAAPAVHAQAGCAILTQDGYAPDQDCDNVPDFLDNCPTVPNADQRDINRNSVGDACDMLINEITVRPDNRLRQGDFAHITVRVLNNRGADLRDITINVRNRDLGIDAIDRIPFVPPGETAATDFWVKVPKCASAQSYPVSITASFKDAQGKTSTEVETETLYVEQGNACKQQSGSLDNTIINVFGQTTVDRGGSAIIPIKIVNLGDSQATYQMSVQDLDGYATWRIDPAQRMTLSAGTSSTANLYLQTEAGAQPGQRDVTLTVISGNQKTTIPVQVYIRAPAAEQKPPFAALFQILFIILLIALIVAALIIATRRKGGKEGGKDTDKGGSKGDGSDDGHKASKTTRREMITEKTTERTITPKKTVAVEDAEEQKLETYY
jgi:hypothetical protein